MIKCLKIFIIFITTILISNDIIAKIENTSFAHLSDQKKDSNYVLNLFKLAGSYATSKADSTFLLGKEICNISDSIKYKNGLGYGYFMIGLSYFVKGMDDSAMFWFQKTLSLFQQTKSPDGLGLAYHNIGRLYGRRNETIKAKENAQKALYYRTIVGNPESILSTVSLLGLFARDEKNTELEEYYQKEALRIAKSINPPSTSGMILATLNLASIELMKNNLTKSEEYYFEALKLLEQIKDINGKTNAYTGLAQISLNKNQYHKAIIFSKKALDNSLLTQNPEGIIGSSEILSKSYEKIGNFSKALYYYKIFQSNKDSINKLQVKKEYVDALARFETEQKESQIKILQKENSLKSIESDFKSLQLNIGIIIVIVLVLIFIAYSIRAKEIKKIETAQNSERLQQNFSSRVLEQQEEERKRIAKELHDSIGQNLLVIKNMIDLSLNSNLKEQEKEKHLQSLSDIASDSIEEVRTIASNLHPYQLSRMNLSKAIYAMVRNLEQSTNINFSVEIDNIKGIFSKEKEAHIYRIIQEAINNSIKHSAASLIKILFKKTNYLITLEISDNGKGFDIDSILKEESTKSGIGLLGIRERSRTIGANFNIESIIGKGTTLTITMST